MTCEEIIARLKDAGNPHNVAGMARFGIRPERPPLGVGIPLLRRLAKEVGPDHRLAGELWRTGIHEARMLAAFIESPAQVTEHQMELWARAFDSWDICDQVTSNLFDKTPWAHAKAVAWSSRPEEYVKRSAFTLMAALAVHDKTSPDAAFMIFLPIIDRESTDDRNFVKKAVNWALRQIGKRNRALHQPALALARQLSENADKTARWIGRDAVRELSSETVQKILARRPEC